MLIGRILLGTPTKRLCHGILGGLEHCTTSAGQSIVAPVLGVALLALLVLAPIATSVYLTRHSKSNDAPRENRTHGLKGERATGLTASRP